VHIGLNLLYLVPGAVGGSETYARELLVALRAHRPADRFTVFCGHEAASVLRGSFDREGITVAELPVRASIKPARIAAELALLPLAAQRHRVDLLHSLGTTSPPMTRSVRVVTVLDLIYDHFPGSFSAPARAGLKLLVPLGARRAHRVIAISAAGRDDLVQRLGVKPTDVDVVHLGLGARPGVDPVPEPALRERWQLGAGPVLLSVSAALPHKNLDRLLRAFALVAQERPDLRLVIVGHAGRLQEQLAALANALGQHERVRFTGWIDQPELEGLYALAAAFAYPSLMEGFGLPVLEAMRRGVPVACSNASAMPEIAGDAALFFDPHDDAAVAAALRRIVDDHAVAAELRRRGRERAVHYSWQRTAAETWQSYERAMAAA
jgi:glycosyltransferase involved in cell wall biosynthesis